MKDELLGAMGSVAGFQGKLLGLSDEFRQFYTSGYRCLRCNTRLLNILGQLTVDFYANNGEKMSMWQLAPLRADIAQCPKCGYRWPTRKGEARSKPTVFETERIEEGIGSDARIIDNSRSAVTLTRTFSISKEWSKSYSIEYEKATVKSGGLNVGLDEMSGLTASFEETVRERFSITRESKEIYTEEIQIQVPASKKLSVIFDWKRVWQLGYLQFYDLNNRESKVPFRVVVGITFDQRQIDDPS
jgi:DNA-directed RNA polymerase subunit RPC12/RpoP